MTARFDRAAAAAGLIMLTRFAADVIAGPSTTGTDTGTDSVTVAATALSLVVAAALLARRRTVPAWPLGLTYCAGAMLVWMAVRSGPAAPEAAKEIGRWITYMAVFVAFATACRSELAARRVLQVLVIGGFGQAVLGLVQFITGDTDVHIAGSATFDRIHGTFQHPGWYGLFLAASLLCCIFVPNIVGRAQPVVGAVIAIALILSWSRSSWLLCALTVCAMVIIERRPRYLAVSSIAVIAALSSSIVRTRLGSELTGGTVEGSLKTRLLLRDEAWTRFMDSRIVGHGTGYFYSEVAPQIVGIPFEVHNDILKTLADLGLVGFTFHVALLFFLAKLLGRRLERSRFSSLGTSVLLSFAVLQSIDTVMRINTTMVLVSIALGAMAGPNLRRRNHIQRGLVPTEIAHASANTQPKTWSAAT